MALLPSDPPPASSFPVIRSCVVLGGGTAGLLAALSFKRAYSGLVVRVIRSADLGVIGVGEGTTPLFPQHLLHWLQLDPAQFFAEAQPTWKLGIRFRGWGGREVFYHTFDHQFDARVPSLPRSNGYYALREHRPATLAAALMASGKAFPRRADGWPDFADFQALHIENKKLIAYLEARCRELGIEFIDAKVTGVEPGPQGIAALKLETGQALAADLFIDASGFRSELLGGALAEPFRSYSDGLFCDRAVIAGWPRTDEPILPFTTAEAMDAGWAWQIEHEHFINRGYVYASQFLSDDAARAEFLRENPRVTTEPRVVKFRSGRYQRSWVGNVVAIGNAAGFVEPLQATAIALILFSTRLVLDVLRDCRGRPTATLIDFYNRTVGGAWDETRDFLSLHYWSNTRPQTPFWQTCREQTNLGDLVEFVRFYRENGPSLLTRECLRNRNNIFGIEGHLVILAGQAVPCHQGGAMTDPELHAWRQHCTVLDQQAAIQGMDVRECLAAIRHPAWRWNLVAQPSAPVAGVAVR